MSSSSGSDTITQDSNKRGEYQSPRSTDQRGPCPIINALANHGYISRDGLNINSVDIRSAMSELGISLPVRAALTYGAYLEYRTDPPKGIWPFIRNPLAYLLWRFGLRKAGQRDSHGIKCLNLDQLSIHGAVEHDVSLTRRDYEQGDNHTPQKDLLAALISSSSNGEDVTTDDFVRLRQKRLAQQKHDNPKLNFGKSQNRVACGEIALVQSVFAYDRDGYDMPVSYLKALFEEERLPVQEGWTKRESWVGFVEWISQLNRISKGIGSID